MDAFHMLAPFIQGYIYDHGWIGLKDIQVQAVSAILESEDHVLISAGTASGKTEAAFFPILSKLYQNDMDSFGVVYIGPLKALINDQFERISDLIKKAEIPLYAWHGDRPQSEKKTAMRNPKGILQITPESLEALLMNHSGDLKRMFRQLQFIVIDEIHAFMGTERGMQLACLLNHLDRITGRFIRRIGLSATIQNIDDALRWLSAGSSLPSRLITSQEGKRQLYLSLKHDEYLPEDEKQIEYLKTEQFSYLYHFVKGRKCLVFTNSRMSAENTAMELIRIRDEKGEEGEFYVHHGSISAALRGETEDRLRETEGAVTAVATKTLELGIDLGHLERVMQMGSPGTCSSFVQRLGRTGRRDQPAVMGFMTENHPQGNSVFDDLPWEMLQCIAVIQLFLEEKWVEPFEEKKCPYSVLFHQTLSMLMRKELKGSELAQSILTLPPFQNVDYQDYLTLLRYMQKTDMIEKTETNTLIPGLRGEKLAGFFEFYAVFHDQSGYSVLFQQKKIGEIDNLPENDQIIVLAGRNWKVSEIDPEKRKIFVVPSKGKTKKQWQGGSSSVHDRIIKKIQEILLDDQIYPYLDGGAKKAIQKARQDAGKYDIQNFWTSLNEKQFLLHPWLGTRKMKTLLFLLKGVLNESLQLHQAVMNNKAPGIYITSELSAEAFIETLRTELTTLDPETLIPIAPTMPIDKYDDYIPEHLRQKAYVYNVLDIEGLKKDI